MKYINPYRLFQGCIVPNWLLRRPEVSSMAKLAYGRMIQYAGRDGNAHPSYATLADELAITRRHAMRLVAELTEHGLLELVSRKTEEGDATSNGYRFPEHAWMAGGGDHCDTMVVPLRSPPVVTAVSPKENHSEENHLKYNIPTSSFDQFYTKYPRHVARSAAERAWKALSPKEELQKIILADIDRRLRIDWANRAKELWPYPATYLNGKRWQDEPEHPADPYAHRTNGRFSRGEQYEEVVPPPFLEK